MTIVFSTVGKNPLEEMEQHSQSKKEPKMQYLSAISKTMEQSQFSFKANHSTLIQVYAPTTKAEEAEVHWFYEFLQHFLE